MKIRSHTNHLPGARLAGRRNRNADARCVCGVLLLVLLSAPAVAQTANLAVGSTAGAAGSGVLLPISLMPGAAGISTLQFDLALSSAFSCANVSTGAAASAAGKSASANSIPGGVRVLVFGLNQNTMGAGVIATLRINVSAAASIGSNPVILRGIVASDPMAFAVPVSAVAGSITRLPPADSANPVISRVSSSSIKIGSATIAWTTNENCDSQVQYGTTAGYGLSASLNSALGTSHSQELTGLTAGTVYHYRVMSRDAAGNLAVSGDYTFTTKVQGAVPVISGVMVSSVTDKSATISWTTDVPSDSEIEYRPANEASERAVLADLVTKHSLILNQLKKSTLYYFRVKSADQDGNLGTTSEFTFTTAEDGVSALALPQFSATAAGQQGPQAADEIMTGMALTNMGPAAADITLTAIDSAGNLLAGPGIVNPKPLVLNAKAQFATLEFQMFGDGFKIPDSGGWIRLDSKSPGVGGFFLTFDAGLSVMDGANFGTTPLTDFAFTEIQPSGNTQINIANWNPDDAVVMIDLMKSDGSVRSSQSRLIQGNGALATDLYGDLFQGLEPDPTDYVLIRSSAGVQPFELMEKRAGDISFLTGQDTTAGGTTIYSPQYVLGGPWHTTLSLVNLDSRMGMVTLRFISEDGILIGVPRAVAIPAYGKLHIDDPDFFMSLCPGEIAAGYVEIVSDGVRLAGSTVFGDSSGESFSSALPLIHRLQNSVLFSHIASNDLYFTGLAIVNPNDAVAQVDIGIYSADGRLMESRSELIPAKQRNSRLLTEYFPSLLGKNQASGYIRLFSNSPVASFALFGTNHLSVLSAIPPQEVQ